VRLGSAASDLRDKLSSHMANKLCLFSPWKGFGLKLPKAVFIERGHGEIILILREVELTLSYDALGFILPTRFWCCWCCGAGPLRLAVFGISLRSATSPKPRVLNAGYALFIDRLVLLAGLIRVISRDSRNNFRLNASISLLVCLCRVNTH